ncbi:MAG TPA: sensor histidine kinase [Nitrospira sp.]|nr:sensor histidine kinase [Nitrospira sp.]
MEKVSNEIVAPGEKITGVESDGEAGRRYREDLRTLAGKLLNVQDEERRRISRDLHDDVNQRLGAIGLQLDSLSRHLPDSPSVVRQRIRTIRRHVTELSDDVRELAYRFHQTTVEDLGLVAALQRYLNDFVKRTGINARFTKPRSSDPVPLRLATCLYRIAQESLGNVGLHAKASQVTVVLTVSSGAVSLTISDNGIGMDFEEVRRRKAGLGMLSMQERARLLNGTVNWDSSLGEGTRVTAHFSMGPESS